MNEGLPLTALIGRKLSASVLFGAYVFSLCPVAPAKGLSSNRGSASRQVVVDVVVTDSKGQAVTGLQAKDFQISEKRKRQRIRAFNVHTQTAKVDAPDLAYLPPNTFTNAGSFEPNSVNVILLDQLNTSFQNQELAREAIVDYMRTKPPGAAFGIFTLRNDDPACLPFNYAQKLFGVTQGDSGGFEPSCLSRGRLLLVQGITHDKRLLLAALDSTLAQPHATQMRPWPQELLSGYLDPGRLDSYPDIVPEVLDSSMSALSDIGEFVRDLPGRKSLIWMSDSFDAEPIAQSVAVWFAGKFKGWQKTDPLAPIQMLHLTADRLAEAEVALYIADLSGKYKDVQVKRACPVVYDDLASALDSSPTRVTKESEEWSCSQHFMKLSYFAAHSGGHAFHGARGVEDALQKAVSDESYYYTLAYLPHNLKLNGSVRNVKVTLARKGYHLAYRRAYFADDPAALYPLDPETSQDVYVPVQSWPRPIQAVRVSRLASKKESSEEVLFRALQYGAPESDDIAFTAHIEPSGGFAEASAEEMAELQDNPSFIPERTEKAMAVLTDAQRRRGIEQKLWRRKHKVTLNALPPAEPVSLQPYSVDYSLALKQLTAGDSDAVHFEAVVVAYDALGKRVNGFRQSVEGTIPKSPKNGSRDPDFHFQQQLRIPDRVTLLRLTICDLLTNRVGSLEVPVWAITSPYRRKVLPLPSSNQPIKSSE